MKSIFMWKTLINSYVFSKDYFASVNIKINFILLINDVHYELGYFISFIIIKVETFTKTFFDWLKLVIYFN